MERRDGAAVVDLGLGNPAEVTEFPQFYLCSGQMGQDDAVQINGLCKPVSEVLLHTVALPLRCLEKVWLQFEYQRVSSWKELLLTDDSVL